MSVLFGKPKPIKPSRILWAGLGILLAYACMRLMIYRATENFSWFATDFFMNIPRLIGLVFAMVALDLYWEDREAVAFWAKGRLAFHIGGAGVLIGLSYGLCRTETFAYHAFALFILFCSSFIVGLFEEMLFRGVILDSLMGMCPRSLAVLISAFLFMIFHIQAQPLSYFPVLFLHGIVFGTLRSEGVGMGWLVLLHAMFDCLVFFGGYGGYTYAWIFPLLLSLHTVFAFGYFQAVFSLSWRNLRSANSLAG